MRTNFRGFGFFRSITVPALLLLLTPVAAIAQDGDWQSLMREMDGLDERISDLRPFHDLIHDEAYVANYDCIPVARELVIRRSTEIIISAALEGHEAIVEKEIQYLRNIDAQTEKCRSAMDAELNSLYERRRAVRAELGRLARAAEGQGKTAGDNAAPEAEKPKGVLWFTSASHQCKWGKSFSGDRDEVERRKAAWIAQQEKECAKWGGQSCHPVYRRILSPAEGKPADLQRIPGAVPAACG